MKKIKFDKNIKANFKQWKFDKKVSRNFEKHVRMSVPLYDLSHEIILGCSDFFLKDGSIFYDLGSSTGSLIKKIHNRHSEKAIKYYGYDNSNEMIKISNKKKLKNVFFQKKN